MTQAQEDHRNKMPTRQGGGAERPRARLRKSMASRRGRCITGGSAWAVTNVRRVGAAARGACTWRRCKSCRLRSPSAAIWRLLVQRGSRAGLGPGFARHVGSSTRDRKNAAADTPRSHQIAQLPGLLALVRDVFVQAESQAPS